MRHTLAAVALLLAVASTVKGQTPFNSLLFTSSNLTDNQAGPTDYATCAAEEPVSDLGRLVPTDQLQTLSVDGRWFGGSATVPASGFSVENCSALALAGGRVAAVFTSTPAPTGSDCTISWYESNSFVTVLVNLTATGSYWTVSLPTVSTAITESSCYGTKSQCLLAATYPCNNVNYLGAALPSYLAASPAGDSSCPAGEYSPDYVGNNDLLFGLEAQYYPDVFNCSDTNPNTIYTAPNLTLLSESSTQCLDTGVDYTISNGSFPSAPSAYSSCYAVDLSGYVYIANYTDLQFLTPEPVPSYYNTYRVCLRFSNLVSFTLDGHLLIESATGDYDAVLTCLDIPYLPQGWVPFNLEYAVPPNGMTNVILQLYIIPVVEVVSDFRPGHTYQLTYECDCCGLFSEADSCCQPVDACDYRSLSCSSPEPPTLSPPPPPVVDPPPPPVPVASPPPPLTVAHSPPPKSHPPPPSPPPPTEIVAPSEEFFPPPPPPGVPVPTTKPEAPAPSVKPIASPPPPPVPVPVPVISPTVSATPPPPLPTLPPPTPPPPTLLPPVVAPAPAPTVPEAQAPAPYVYIPPMAPATAPIGSSAPVFAPGPSVSSKPPTVSPPGLKSPPPPPTTPVISPTLEPPAPAPGLCPCPPEGRRRLLALLEETTSTQHNARDFSFADFQELVKDAPTWEALEAALQS